MVNCLSPEDRERQRSLMSMNECDIVGDRTKFTDTVERWEMERKSKKKEQERSRGTENLV